MIQTFALDFLPYSIPLLIPSVPLRTQKAWSIFLSIRNVSPKCRKMDGDDEKEIGMRRAPVWSSQGSRKYSRDRNETGSFNKREVWMEKKVGRWCRQLESHLKETNAAKVILLQSQVNTIQRTQHRQPGSRYMPLLIVGKRVANWHESKKENKIDK